MAFWTRRRAVTAHTGRDAFTRRRRLADMRLPLRREGCFVDLVDTLPSLQGGCVLDQERAHLQGGTLELAWVEDGTAVFRYWAPPDAQRLETSDAFFANGHRVRLPIAQVHQALEVNAKPLVAELQALDAERPGPVPLYAHVDDLPVVAKDELLLDARKYPHGRGGAGALVPLGFDLTEGPLPQRTLVTQFRSPSVPGIKGAVFARGQLIDLDRHDVGSSGERYWNGPLVDDTSPWWGGGEREYFPIPTEDRSLLPHGPALSQADQALEIQRAAAQMFLDRCEGLLDELRSTSRDHTTLPALMERLTDTQQRLASLGDDHGLAKLGHLAERALRVRGIDQASRKRLESLATCDVQTRKTLIAAATGEQVADPSTQRGEERAPHWRWRLLRRTNLWMPSKKGEGPLEVAPDEHQFKPAKRPERLQLDGAALHPVGKRKISPTESVLLCAVSAVPQQRAEGKTEWAIQGARDLYRRARGFQVRDTVVEVPLARLTQWNAPAEDDRRPPYAHPVTAATLEVVNAYLRDPAAPERLP